MRNIPAVLLALALPLPLTAGCTEHVQTVWHEERLPSGKTIKVTSLNLVWGIEHGDRDTGKDCLALEYVAAAWPEDPARREGEAAEAFELIRATSEQWGLETATIAAFPTLQRKGHYDLYLFRRQPNGRWSFTRTDAKVFASD